MAKYGASTPIRDSPCSFAEVIGLEAATREFGDTWLREVRTAVLRVLSVMTGGRENNILINPLHPQFSKISVSEPEPIHWDR
jgi:RES domain-containing protein